MSYGGMIYRKGLFRQWEGELFTMGRLFTSGGFYTVSWLFTAGEFPTVRALENIFRVGILLLVELLVQRSTGVCRSAKSTSSPTQGLGVVTSRLG